jgi:hypothetical protein
MPTRGPKEVANDAIARSVYGSSCGNSILARGTTIDMPANDPTEVGLDTAIKVIARRVHDSACRNWCLSRGPTIDMLTDNPKEVQ